MRIDSIVKVKSLGGEKRRVEVYLPKFSIGVPFIVLGSEYQYKDINFITDKSDIKSGNIKINNCSFNQEDINNITFIRGMRIEYEDSITVDIFVPEKLISRSKRK